MGVAGKAHYRYELTDSRHRHRSKRILTPRCTHIVAWTIGVVEHLVERDAGADPQRR